MSRTTEELMASMEQTQEQVRRVTEKIFSAAQPGAVFGQPVQAGNYTVITASEVVAGGGFGFGAGWGPGPEAAHRAAGEEAVRPEGPVPPAGGSGGGGGGWSMGRPVATIVVGPDGVKFQPVVDVTKIAIAAVTAWAAMLGAMRGFRRMARR